MGLVHVPRIVTAVAKGFARRSLSPLSENEKALIGIGRHQPPHVYTSRAGLFDVDLMLHMNNASYLTHAEYARWEWNAFGGSLTENLRSQSYFIVTASMLRFRREIPPFQKFEIQSRIGGIDERNVWVYQTFHQSSTSSDRSKVLAQVLTQAVIAKRGKIISPREWIEKNFPVSKEILDELSIASSEVESLFDEKAARFKDLEEILRKSASLYDKESTT